MDSNINHLPDHTHTAAVLAVSLAAEDQRTLEAAFRQLPWRLKTAATLAQGLRLATSPTVRVVICEREVPGGNWKVLFEKIRDLATPPRFIVASRLADERLWAEILNVGGYDVLATPFDTDELRRVLSYAVDSGRREVPRLAKCR
jgi:DNA-binding NtrC family response regulator